LCCQGFAAAALDLTPEEAAATKSVSLPPPKHLPRADPVRLTAAVCWQLPKIFIFGGETFNVTGGSGGMKNDVYSTTGAKWLVYENFMGYNKNGDFEPRVVSQTKWTQVIAGRSPPPFVSYRYWTSCVAEGIPWRSTDRPNCDVIWREPALYKPDLMWSPRRSHAAISFLGELYIMGGRAREGEDIRELASIGSIYTPEAINVTTVHRTTAKNRDEVVWRERVVLKNDVWKSKDGGSNWELLNPGCMSSTPQTTRKAGLSDSQFNNAGGGVQCFTSDQCFGDADCSFGKCICKIWDARERHTAVVFGAPRPFIYVLGGFIERELQTCGKETTSSTHGRKSGEEYACGGQYRGYMPDVWRSLDGIKWQLMKSKAWPGRGEHVSWVLDGILFVAGGRTGHSWKKEESYLNDVWLTQDGYMWTQMMEHAEWEPRGNLEAVVVPKSSLARMSTVHIFGGAGGVAGKETYFNDMWTWHSIAGEPWAQDYNNYTFSYKYVRDDSPIDMLRLRVPMDVMSAADVLKLQALGVNTINELANLPVDVAVELRTALNNKGVANVCEQKDLARAIVRKCASPAPEHDQVQSEIQDIPIGKYYGEDATRFKYYNERPKRILLNETTRAAKRREEEADPWEEEVEGWDGCTQIGIKVLDPYTGGSVYADIDGIPQVQSVQPTWRIEEELICQQVFTPREYMRGLMFQDMMYAFGGRTKRDNDPDVGSWGAQVYHNDVWYRDGVLPVSSFTLKPDSYSSQLSFKFEADEQGCIFEWRLNDWSENRVEMNWTKSAGRLTVSCSSPRQDVFLIFVVPSPNRSRGSSSGGIACAYVVSTLQAMSRR
jgi:hypothetical protein